ncbi:MAG: hypothetical protein L0216_05885 [Planctomycetales bacterium]|nr:hypothetical protein [Planctomycetales bacterium]
MGSFLITDVGLRASADRFSIRDARGQSARPAVRRVDGGLAVEGPVSIRAEYSVRKVDAIRFLDVTRDENRLHRDHEIVPGALTASRVVALLEVLAPDLVVTDVSMKFTAPCVYGARTLSIVRLSPEEDGTVTAEAETFHAGETAAKASIKAKVVPYSARAVPVADRKVNATHLGYVRDYFLSLGLDPEAYFHKGTLGAVGRAATCDHTYPIAYLASLPPGELVRRFEGQGGILNALSLQFGDAPRVPITGHELPEVALEHAKARPSLFARVVTRIVQGITTYGRGFALVMHRAASGGAAPQGE